VQPPTVNPNPAPTPALKLTAFVSGLANPVDLEIADDNSARMFVVEQAGDIRIISNGAVLPTSFLDISAIVSPGLGELGLLGITFHPHFASDPRFYLNYTRTIAGNVETVIAEYRVSAGDPNLADAGSERVLLTVAQPFSNHKAGQLAFGNDGYLYFGLGDGGSGGDPNGNGQNTHALLGKMLRIDVDHTGTSTPYAIPPDNPFANGVAGSPEIFAYGFRNPWRFSFDRPTGRLFVADVGQNLYEEIDLVENGKNYGWNTMEGNHCYNPSSNCDMTGLTLPILEYDHSGGSSAVIGGYVYHGSIPGLAGTYIYGDLSGGKIWGLTENADHTWTRADLITAAMTLTSMGQDASGELYVVDYSGAISKIVPQ
jgi:glucose/arabinose dehydrogenase